MARGEKIQVQAIDTIFVSGQVSNKWQARLYKAGMADTSNSKQDYFRVGRQVDGKGGKDTSTGHRYYFC